VRGGLPAKPLATACLVLTLAVLVFGLAKGWGLGLDRPRRGPATLARLVVSLDPPPLSPRMLDKDELAPLIGHRDLGLKDLDYFMVESPMGEPLFVKTTLDPELQPLAQKWVKGAGALRAALVVLEPASGRILALAGSGDEEGNAALEGSFPAASVFKIVTAAAAVEKADYNAMTTVAYDGAKHTLYKGNVSKAPDKGVHQATLREGFAESINSVFGKLGAFSLAPGELEEVAVNFGFNENLAFEMPLDVSTFELGDDPGDTFHLAELASGFNRDTRLSPVHGALLASVALNGGDLFEPNIVSEVTNLENEIVYRGRPRLLGRAVSPQTAEELSVLMQAAVSDGTGRKHFSDAGVHPVLSRLTLGGKSGTINDDDGARVDWFVAFASPDREEDDAGQLALAAVVVHDGQTNTASQELVRKALISYYRARLGPGKEQEVMAGRPSGRS
jgi:membrane peptidoglycan carboxypeptidase